MWKLATSHPQFKHLRFDASKHLYYRSIVGHMRKISLKCGWPPKQRLGSHPMGASSSDAETCNNLSYPLGQPADIKIKVRIPYLLCNLHVSHVQSILQNGKRLKAGRHRKLQLMCPTKKKNQIVDCKPLQSPNGQGPKHKHDFQQNT